MKEGGFSAGDVHLGIAGLRAITRELEMPLVPDSEIDAAVRLQALDVIPFAIDKALISARPLEETVGANGMPERRVLVAAAHRDLVDPLVEVVTAAGLDAGQRRADLFGDDPRPLRPGNCRPRARRRSSRSAPDSPRSRSTRTASPTSSARSPKVATPSPLRSRVRSTCRWPTPRS